MATEKRILLELSEPVGGQISIKGTLYDTIHPDALSMQERVEFSRIAKQFTNIADLSDSQAKELGAVMTRVIKQVLNAPDTIIETLPDGHKLAIINAVFSQEAGSKESVRNNTEPSQASSDSTEAIR